MNKKLLILIMLVILIAVFVAIAIYNHSEDIACTQDVKICEDGSYVSRNSDNGCEFYPCPG